MMRFRKALLVAGLLVAPAVAVAQAPPKRIVDLPSAPDATFRPTAQVGVAPVVTDKAAPIPATPAAPAGPISVAPSGVVTVGPGCQTGNCGAALPVPDHKYLPNDYLLPDYSLFPKPSCYRWDGRFRVDIEAITGSATRPAGFPDENLEGLRVNTVLWLDKDQRIGLQGTIYGAVNRRDEFEDLLRYATDAQLGELSAARLLNGRESLSPTGFFSSELLARGLIHRTDCFRLDWLAGVRTLTYTSAIVSRSVTGLPAPTALPGGTVSTEVIGVPVIGNRLVNFQSRGAASTWAGPEVGLAGEYWHGRLWLDGSYKFGYGWALGRARGEVFVINPGAPTTATRTLYDYSDDDCTCLHEFNVGLGVMVCRHVGLRVGYTYTRVGRMLQNDPTPTFRSYNQHLVSAGLTFRF